MWTRVSRLHLTCCAFLILRTGAALAQTGPSTDPYYFEQWTLHATSGSNANINIEPAWAHYAGRPTNRLGIMALGVPYRHEDFLARYIEGGTEVDESGNLVRSQVATEAGGLMSAGGDNGIGIAGINWRGNIYGRNFEITNDSKVADSFNWFDQNAVTDVAMSWWLDGITDQVAGVLRSRTRLAFLHNSLVFVPAPIAGTEPGAKWADYYQDGTVAVGAVRQTGTYATNTQAHVAVEFTIPVGDETGGPVTTQGTFGYSYTVGRNLHAAGAAAACASLIRGYGDSLGLSLSNDDVLALMRNSSGTHDVIAAMHGGYVGAGVVDEGYALDLLGTPNVMKRASVTGGTIVETSTDPIQWSNVLGLYGLAPEIYYLFRRTVEQDVAFPDGGFAQVKAVWIRRLQTVGSANFQLSDLPYAEIIPGSVTNTGCRVRTYAYRVLTGSGAVAPGEWYPCHPNNVVVSFGVIGVPVPLSATISGTSTLYCPNTGSWTAHPVGGTGAYAYEWHAVGVPGVLSTAQTLETTNPAGTGSFELYCNVTSGGAFVQPHMPVTWSCNDGGGGGGDGDGDPCFRNGCAPLSRLMVISNPVRGDVNLAVSLAAPAQIDVRAYDIGGREVAIVHRGMTAEGRTLLTWNTRGLPIGVYEVRMKVADVVRTAQAIIVK